MRHSEADIRAIQTWLHGDEPDDMDSLIFAAEERKERDWHDLESSARDFVKLYGAEAMVRCISRALGKPE